MPSSQWRHPCDCHPGTDGATVDDNIRMHTEQKRNDDDSVVITCNVCGDRKVANQSDDGDGGMSEAQTAIDG